MISEVLYIRLESVLRMLNANYDGVRHSPSALKGAARADFINNYLKNVIPQGLRIRTSGEIIDSKNNQTGELDIVIENGHFPNIPIVSGDSSRLYFAEGVAAVIEVKSNLQSQWNEALSTGEKLSKIARNFSGTLSFDNGGTHVIRTDRIISNPVLPKITTVPQAKMIDKVPYFIVGYTGWSDINTLSRKIKESSDIVSGVLQLDNGFFVSGGMFKEVLANGPLCLLAFINCIYESYGFIKSPSVNLLSYGMN
ncbi:DUF6602 domain-containing protein [Serratia ureilytica]|uniref:DUF6602 domain-containing protein n=1 Tax=Serratia ureilytica TaxID=300181 RepID=UPI001F454862|nr:DUF6602 domain-containing protein [Serratia ureilytica]BEO41892.1 hypothetical protein SMQE13_12430 [Serratia marcescens]